MRINQRDNNAKGDGVMISCEQQESGSPAGVEAVDKTTLAQVRATAEYVFS